MEKYTTTETKSKPEIVAHVAKTLDGVSEELAKDLGGSARARHSARSAAVFLTAATIATVESVDS